MWHSRIGVTQFMFGRSVFVRYYSARVRFLAHLCIICEPIIYIYISTGLLRSFYFASDARIRLKLIRAIISAANIAISCCFIACRLCTRLETRGVLSWNTTISRESTRFLLTVLRLLRLYEIARYPSVFYLFHVRSSLSRIVSLLYTCGSNVSP